MNDRVVTQRLVKFSQAPVLYVDRNSAAAGRGPTEKDLRL
jgi:hypothetical protein